MTDAERNRLDKIACENRDTPMRHGDQAFLIDLVRREAGRADVLQLANDIYLRDCGTGHGAKGERDAVWIEGVRRLVEQDVVRECVSLVDALPRDAGTGQILAAIRGRFIPTAGPTLSERVTAEVAQQCVEIAEQVALDPEAGDAETVANAIRELFGFTAGARPEGEYTVQTRFTMQPTPAELDAAAGFPADLDEQIADANAHAHEGIAHERP